jgi:putative resolvase
MDMKLSQYAKRAGVTYKTAWRWYKAGMLDAYQTETGTIIVREERNLTPTTGRIALYARVSSADQKDDLARQLERLRDYTAAKGYTVAKEIVEIASGLNDSRPKLAKLLSDPTIGTIIVEHKDRLTRFGFQYIRQLLEVQNRRIELIFETDTNDELVDDFVAVITSMAARMYGRRHAKQRALCIKDCLDKCLEKNYEDHARV